MDALRKVRNPGDRPGPGPEGRRDSAGETGPGGSAVPCDGAEDARTLPAGSQCIIVDDVLTTGATLAEAARAVHEAGGIVRGAVVLAATRPPMRRPAGARTGRTARLAET